MPRTFNYSLVRLEDRIRRRKLTEPFNKCVAIFKTRIPVLDAHIDGFKVESIDQNSKDGTTSITASGSATIENMKDGDLDKSLTIYVGFDINPMQRQKTVSVTLTDDKGETYVWNKSNEEARQ